MDDLLERCQGYYAQGARFAKWRAVIRIDEATSLPTRACIQINSAELTRYGTDPADPSPPTPLLTSSTPPIPTHQHINQPNPIHRYAAVCQACGLVPIVEPEILIEGSHSAETFARVTEAVLSEVYYALAQAKVFLEGCVRVWMDGWIDR
jgi:fructose-bisphosphate aldolase, class I